MDDLEIFDTPLVDATDIWQLLLRFAFNSAFVWIIIHFLYYPKSNRRDYYFTFALISVSIFFLIYLLGSVKIKIGFALGLFAIFGIIRYRTESMSVREMTYLFVIISVSVINALAVRLSYLELLVTNLVFVASIRLCERVPLLKHVAEKWVLYDRIELIRPERHDELVSDLEARIGIKVERVEIGSVDFLRDTAMLKVYYRDDNHVDIAGRDNSADRVMKIPKENQ